MSRRRALDYEQVISAILELLGDDRQVEKVVMDYENALWSAFRNLNEQGLFGVPLTLRGCHFHFCQSVYRKMKSIGLENQYLHNGPSAFLCRKIMALALIPHTKIRRCMNYLQSEVDRIDTTEEHGQQLQYKFNRMLNYMENQWLNGRMFQVKDWSVYGQFVRTTNHVEGDHNRLNSISYGKKLRPVPLVTIN